MTKADIRNWALKGAEHRLLEIATEASEIHRAFPELRDRGTGALSGRRRGRPRKDAENGTDPAPRRRRRRKMSAEARKRISDAQKARWAKQNGQSVGNGNQQPAMPARGSEPTKEKRTMSAEARGKIAAAQKRRWQTQKAGGKTPSSLKTNK